RAVAVAEAAAPGAAARVPRRRRAPACPLSAQAGDLPAAPALLRTARRVAGTGGRWPPPVVQGAPQLPCSAGIRPPAPARPLPERPRPPPVRPASCGQAGDGAP